MRTECIKELLSASETVRVLETIYPGDTQAQIDRYLGLSELYTANFGESENLRFCSAPGRAEIAGNHTDHNNGRVLAAAVNLDTVAAAAPSGNSTVTLYSEGYETPFVVNLENLQPIESEKNTTQALIRGVAAGMKNARRPIGGFNAYVTSSVFKGSGLSSSAAFEVMICQVFDTLFGNGDLDAQQRAVISQFAENRYFGKPCGLLDQMASSVGGLVTMDFRDSPARIEAISYDFAGKGFAPVVVSAGGDHGNLTDQYAAIPGEMKQVARAMGGEVLRDIDRDTFWSSLPKLKSKVPDRAILRAMHFYDEDARIPLMVEALKNDDTMAFLRGIEESGESSWKLLQNLFVPGRDNQEMVLALAMSQHILKGRGACRIHGGGFAGTILAFVPLAMLESYTDQMDSVFGRGACTVLSVRPTGPVSL